MYQCTKMDVQKWISKCMFRSLFDMYRSTDIQRSGAGLSGADQGHHGKSGTGGNPSGMTGVSWALLVYMGASGYV